MTTNVQAMFLRTLILGVCGAISGVIGFVIVSWLPQPVAPELIYLAPIAGLVAGVVGNLVNEYFGLYKVNLWRRLFPRKRD
jgi:hypothetical protein